VAEALGPIERTFEARCSVDHAFEVTDQAIAVPVLARRDEQVYPYSGRVIQLRPGQKTVTLRSPVSKLAMGNESPTAIQQLTAS
jgi:hypothetical protein